MTDSRLAMTLVWTYLIILKPPKFQEFLKRLSFITGNHAEQCCFVHHCGMDPLTPTDPKSSQGGHGPSETEIPTLTPEGSPSPDVSNVSENSDHSKNSEPPEPPKRKRGRPPKVKPVLSVVDEPLAEEEEEAEKAKRKPRASKRDVEAERKSRVCREIIDACPPEIRAHLTAGTAESGKQLLGICLTVVSVADGAVAEFHKKRTHGKELMVLGEAEKIIVAANLAQTIALYGPNLEIGPAGMLLGTSLIFFGPRLLEAIRTPQRSNLAVLPNAHPETGEETKN